MGTTLLTCGNGLLTCGNDLLTCGNDFLSCGNDLLSCGNDLVSWGNDLLTCGNDFLSCGNDLLTCGNDFLSCGNDLLSCGNEIKKCKENSSMSLPGLRRCGIVKSLVFAKCWNLYQLKLCHNKQGGGLVSFTVNISKQLSLSMHFDYLYMYDRIYEYVNSYYH